MRCWIDGDGDGDEEREQKLPHNLDKTMNKEEEKKLIFIIQCASVDSAMSEFWCYNENVFGHLIVMMVLFNRDSPAANGAQGLSVRRL